MKKPAATKAGGFLSNLLPSAPADAPAAAAPTKPKAAPVGEGPELPTEKLSTKITPSNALTLARAAYWKPGKAQVQSLVNDALKHYFEHVYEGNMGKTPDE